MSKYLLTFDNRLALLRCVVGCSLLFMPPPTYGSDAAGTVRFASCDFLAALRLELVRFQKANLENPLVFKLPRNPKGVVGSAHGLPAARPMRDRERQDQILHVSYGRRSVSALSGNFAVSYIDGRKLEGSFSAKGIQPATEIICE
jgi:hypothetical protein